MISRRALRGACVGGGILMLAAALWAEQRTLRRLWEKPSAPPPFPILPRLDAGPDTGRNRAQYDRIHQWLGPPPPSPKEIPANLPCKIVGGFMEMGSGPDQKYVSIQNSAGSTSVYKVGDEVKPDKVKILVIDVAQKSVRALWRDKEWTLTWKRGEGMVGKPSIPFPGLIPAPSGPSGGGATSETSGYEITDEQFQDYVKNFLNKYWQQVSCRAMPDGGFKIERLTADAEVRKFGLKEGDIVKSINGTDLKSLDEIVRVFGTLTADTSLTEYTLAVKRGEKPFEVKIKVKR